MPLFLIGAGLGGLAGFFLGNGATAATNIIKWGVIGGGVFVAGRALKVI